MRKFETHMLQDVREFDRFLNFIIGQNVKSFLEIGSKNGGTFWRISNVLPRGSRVVSVDLPQGDTSFKETQPNLEQCVGALAAAGYDSYLFLGDSTDPVIIEKVRQLGPFDLCFIDANHTEPYVRKDWENYGSISNIVAFHDIGWIARPEPSKKMPIEVPKVWNEIKQGFEHIEIRLCPRDNGIGVLWRNRPISGAS